MLEGLRDPHLDVMFKRIQQGLEAWTVTLIGATISLCFADPALAQSERLLLEPMAVQSARPDDPIRHDLKIKSVLDSASRKVSLEGPTHHSHASATARDAAKKEARFNWYAIAKPLPGSPREVAVSLENGGKQTVKVSLGKAVHFLSAAKKLSDGKPPPAPDHLSHFVAYRIDRTEGGSPAAVVFSSGTSTIKVRPAKAVFLCLPAEEWHHGEHSPVHDAGFCFLVYETQVFGEKTGPPIGTLDQFGLNSLQLSRSKLVGVPARIVSSR